jgi:hypothetical protein
MILLAAAICSKPTIFKFGYENSSCIVQLEIHDFPFIAQ